MAYFLFLDESGQDRRESPYEVLAGIAVKDQDVWNLIDAIKNVEERAFGIRYSAIGKEIKGKTFLKRKTYRLAAQESPIDPTARVRLASACLRSGDGATKEQLTALSQAKIAFVGDVLALCDQFQCKVFASIVNHSSPPPSNDILRKDYAFLFERYFYFLEDRGADVQGVIVFDELERSQSRLLIGQMERYFLRTQRGRLRSRQVIPEPFFVHSELTTMIQVADLIAYVISWACRNPDRFDAPARQELGELGSRVEALAYRTRRDLPGKPSFNIRSFAWIDDLRGWEDRHEEGKEKRQ